MSVFSRIATAAFLTVSTATTALAVEIVEQHNSNALWFENWVGLSNGTLTIVAPNGEQKEIFAASGTPVFELSGRDVQDGTYRYALSAATEEKAKIVNQIDNGRGDKASDTAAVPFHYSGSFVVSRGVIIKQEEIKEEEG